jgi:hypothetical protein
MAKNGRWVMIAFLVLIALPLAAIAQNATQTVDLGDGYTITVPAGWEPDLSDETIFVFYGDTLVLGLNTPTMLTTMGWDNPGDFVDVVDALVNLANTADGSSLTRNDTRKAQFDGRSAATYAGPLDDTTDGLQVTLEMSDGAIGYLVFLGTTADLDASRDEMDAIIASFDVAEAPTASSAGSGGSCTVRTSSANSGQLRVGPGENRSAIAFLPANTDVTVTGRTELDDGSVWYQLDKDEAAPQGTAAAELWVSAENVEATGGCDTVGETSAPPVIPISVAPPAATAAPGEPAPAPVQAGALPAAGVWTLSLAPITNASCLGYENVAFNTSEVYTQPTFNGTLSIVDGGSFRFDGSLFRRNGNSNSFSGAIEIPYEGGGSVTTQFRFDLISATRMTGQMVANYNADDGTPCSDTVAFSASR